MLIDSHTHLQWASFDRDRKAVIKRAMKAGVQKIVTVGFNLKGSRKAVKLAQENPGVCATVGIHPHSAKELTEDALQELKQLSTDRSVVAIGEIGLDYYRYLSPRHIQKQAFTRQLTLAEELDLPVVVHDRDAHADVLEILSMHRPRRKGVMHCFSGSRETAMKAISLNFYISFAGTITFPSASQLQDVVRWIDLRKVLVETDCPWLTPQEFRGKRNEPAYLPFIANKLGILRGIPLGEIAEITTQNASDVLLH
ncbi:MAG: TatD family hydrolase [Candidatus Bathyarchaeota archaeon]|nr:MAG: TatD family hydrolase [Candidatus Bathyarchaeota archaeon]